MSVSEGLIDPREEVVINLLIGLATDGESNKQYYLEKALRSLCEDSYVDKSKKILGWKSVSCSPIKQAEVELRE